MLLHLLFLNIFLNLLLFLFLNELLCSIVKTPDGRFNGKLVMILKVWYLKVYLAKLS